jgi:hydrogenase/urease accessory protein HupE
VALVAALFVLAGGRFAGAHEIGTTRVSAVFHDGRYEIEIATDATALTEKLDVVSPETKGQSLEARDAIFRRRIRLEFDGTAAEPAITYAITPPVDAVSAVLATIRLAGDIPAGARRFSWTCSWTFASYALTLKSGDNGQSTEWLEGGQASTPYSLTTPPPRVSRMQIAWRYLALGFTHIVPYGLDHMLFVLGIFLLSNRLRTMLWQVSAFTIAHSITLGLSVYGVLTLPPSIVEPAIAVSIAYVAIENLVLTEVKPWRIGLVFAFGLLHGLGFAGALKEIGLPRSEFLTALLTFNVGVEGGQLAVIASAFLLVGWVGQRQAWYRRLVVVPASVLIACTALYWTVERL